MIEQGGDSTISSAGSARRQVDISNHGPRIDQVRAGFDAGELVATRCTVNGSVASCQDLAAGSLDVGGMDPGSTLTVEVTLSAPAEARSSNAVEVRAWAENLDTGEVATDSATLTWAPSAAPKITEPARASVVSERRPRVAGTAEPAAAVTVWADGVPVCGNVPVTPSGTWHCQPRVDLPFGRVSLVARQRERGAVAATARQVFFVRPPAPHITRPAPGAVVTELRPQIAGGGAVAGARVTVVEDGRAICSVRVGTQGRWACPIRVRPASGTHRVYAVQSIGGVSSERSQPVEFTVTPRTDGTSGEVPAPVEPAVPPVEPPAARPLDPGVPRPSRQNDGAAVRPDPPSARDRGLRNPDAAPSTPIGVRLARPAAPLARGVVTRLVSTLGPNPSSRPVALRVTGSLDRGLVYRSVGGNGARCAVESRTYTCEITVEPRRSATLEARILPDAIHAPTMARQRVVASFLGSRQTAGTMTTSYAVAPDPATTKQHLPLSAQLSAVPGGFVSLLALLMLALAAAEETRRRNLDRRPHDGSDRSDG